jgi:hypothetical protein
MTISQADSRGRLLRFLIDNLGQEISSGSLAGSGSFVAVNSDDELVLARPLTGAGISWDGSTANGVATYKDADEATVESNLTFDGSTLTVTGDASISGDVHIGQYIYHIDDTDTKIGFGTNTQIYTCQNSERLKLNSTGVGMMGATPIAGLAITGDLTISGDTTLGDASGDSLTINAQTINPANIDTGTDNSVVVYNGSSLVTDEIDSRVWGSTLVDASGTPADNQVGIWTDANTMEGSSNLTFDGTDLTVANDLILGSDIIHSGDTDTKIGFGANTQTYTCQNSERLKLNSTGVGMMGATPIAGLAVTGDLTISGDTTATSGSFSDVTLTSHTGIIGTNSHRTIIHNNNGGYLEAKTGHATYGFIIRDYNSEGWANITTNNGLLQLAYNNNSTTDGIFLNDSDNVGIGDSSPSYKLDVNGTLRATGDMYADGELTVTSDLDVRGDTFLDGAIILGGQSSLGTGMRAEFRNTGGQTYSSFNGVYWESCIANNSHARTVLTNEAYEDNDVVGPGIYSSNIYWFWKYTAAATTYRVITSGTSFTFTGQHLTVPMDSAISSSLSDYVGLIAVSSGNQMRWDEIKEEWVTGSEAVTINETLPRIELATSRADKRVFGVISNRPDNYVVNSETNEIEEDQDGMAYSWNDLKQTQIRVNSLGEGAIWVCNINGNLENGDYITSCEVPGLGMKQDDDLLHNYTVAKITQACDFRINASNYNVVEFEHSGSTYRKAFVGCTYHCG